MKYRALGNTGLLVSELVIGTVPFGGRGAFEKTGSVDVALARRMFDMAFDVGVNLVDTADLYSHGLAEEIVGQALGRQEPREARFAAGVSMAAALGYACISASLMFVLREQIAQIYTPDKTVIAVAATLIVYAALFQFSDAIQVTAAGALRGYQDTRITMLLTLFAYWGIGLPVGYALGLSDLFGEPSGPSGLWQGLVVGLTCAAAMLTVRLARSARKRIRRAA